MVRFGDVSEVHADHVDESVLDYGFDESPVNGGSRSPCVLFDDEANANDMVHVHSVHSVNSDRSVSVRNGTSDCSAASLMRLPNPWLLGNERGPMITVKNTFWHVPDDDADEDDGVPMVAATSCPVLRTTSTQSDRPGRRRRSKTDLFRSGSSSMESRDDSPVYITTRESGSMECSPAYIMTRELSETMRAATPATHEQPACFLPFAAESTPMVGRQLSMGSARSSHSALEELCDPMAVPATQAAAAVQSLAVPGEAATSQRHTSAQALAAKAPETSIGASLHGSGECRPCAWFWRPQGCDNGTTCRHCHLCPEGEIKLRRKLRLTQRESAKGRGRDRVVPAPSQRSVLSGAIRAPVRLF